MRFSPLREHRVKLAAAARASWSLCAVSGFLGDFLLRTCSTFFLFPSLSLAFSFFFYYYLKHPLFRNCWSLETNFRAYFKEFAAFRWLCTGYYMDWPWENSLAGLDALRGGDSGQAGG